MPASAPITTQVFEPSIKRWWYQPSRRLQTQENKIKFKNKRKEEEDERKGIRRNAIYSRLTDAKDRYQSV